MKTEEKSMQKFIEKELSKDNRTKLDFRIFNRKTGSFYENSPEMMLPAAENAFILIDGEKIPVDKIVIQRYIGVQEPEWDECEIISNICEMDGHTQEYV